MDASGLGNAGTADGSATVAAGQFGNALSLPDTASYVSCGTNLPNAVLKDAFTPKLVSSIAHAYGRPHVMSEVSAHAQGGKVTPMQMYASMSLQYALGVDTFTSYYSEQQAEPALPAEEPASVPETALQERPALPFAASPTSGASGQGACQSRWQ